VVKKLIENGAKGTAVNVDGVRAMPLSLSLSLCLSVSLCLVLSVCQVTPLLAAMNHDNMEMMTLLLSKGADANVPDKVLALSLSLSLCVCVCVSPSLSLSLSLFQLKCLSLVQSGR
jgi:ankyrin repeat protein